MATTYRIDADTSALSTKLNAARRQFMSFGKEVQGIAPGMAALATSAGVIAAAGALATRAWRDYFERLAKANRDTEDIARNAQGIAFGVGRPGIAESLTQDIRVASTTGQATREQLGTAAAAFTSRATAATSGQLAGAVSMSARILNAGASDADAQNIARAAGVLVDAGVDTTLAFQLAAQLVTTAGQQAPTVINQLPALLSAGVSPEQAVAALLAGRSLLGGEKGASAVASAAERFIQGGGRGGFAGFQRSLNQRLRGLGDAAAGGVAGVSTNFIEQLESEAAANQQLRLQNQVGAIQNEARNRAESTFASEQFRVATARASAATADISDPIGLEYGLRFAEQYGVVPAGVSLRNPLSLSALSPIGGVAATYRLITSPNNNP